MPNFRSNTADLFGKHPLACLALCSGVLAMPAFAQDTETNNQADANVADAPSQTRTSVHGLPLPAGAIEAFPGVFVDRANKRLLIEGMVIADENMEWIELLACTAGTREHESLLAVKAEPSHVHAALLTLGLKPGAPRTVEKIEAEADAAQATEQATEAIEPGQRVQPKFVVHPAHGPKLKVHFQHLSAGPAKAAKEAEATDKQTLVTSPAHTWLTNQDTGEAVPEMTFLFTGSYMYDHEGQTHYAANTGGTVVSLVQFGDDLIACDTDKTNRDGSNPYKANAANLPPKMSHVLLVIQADTAPENGPKNAPANTDPKAETADASEAESSPSHPGPPPVIGD